MLVSLGFLLPILARIVFLRLLLETTVARGHSLKAVVSCGSYCMTRTAAQSSLSGTVILYHFLVIIAALGSLLVKNIGLAFLAMVVSGHFLEMIAD